MADDSAYRWFFRQSPAYLGSIDRKGRFVDASDTWLKRLGYQREEFVGREPQEMMTTDSARLVVNEYLPAFRRTGKLTGVPLEWVSSDGEVVSVLMDTQAKRAPDGTIAQSMSVFYELQDTARLERHYRDLYRRTPAMLYSVDSQGRLLAASDVCLSRLGYSSTEMIGRPITDFMTAPSRARYDEQLNDLAFGTGHLSSTRLDFVSKKGEVIEAEVAAEADCDECRETLRVLGIIQDVTAKNRAERQRERAAQEISRLNEELSLERNYLREEVTTRLRFGEIVGESPPLQQALSQITAVAETDATVLIHGESGTGKELFARVLHKESQRGGGPLVKVNCASVPHELFESEFFGHVRGSFTGAVRDRVGRFELAKGGTILLDEVGEIPLTLQAKLLRVLQERTFERVGDERTRKVDVRIVAATNRDLRKEVDAGRFREDLYYRLNVFPVEVPPLRDRGEDIVHLAQHFLKVLSDELGRPNLPLSERQAEDLRNYSWPGNVRELQNVLERALILSSGSRLVLDPAVSQHSGPTTTLDFGHTLSRPGDPAHASNPIVTAEDLKQFEKQAMRAVLDLTHGVISGETGAAARFGLKASTFTYRMKALGISPRR